MLNALGKMTSINQFIVWRLTWDKEKNKYHKVPINVQKPDFPADASSPANWLPFDLATQWSVYLNIINTDNIIKYTPGFYFTEECGYWFLDVDNALEETNTGQKQFTPTAQSLFAHLNGCAFEWSSSQRGYHIFGKGKLTGHRQIKPAGTGLELYTSGRAVAFGLSGEMQGSADTDHSAVMHDLIIPSYFPLQVSLQTNECDFSAPREDYYCTLSDSELLQLMLRSESASAKLNIEKPIFSDFYNANLPILQNYYKGDESAYDAAFASLLAFWTGCDAPRMKRYMLSSGLMREKWERKDYLDRTIRNACWQQVNVYQMRKPIEMKDVEVAEDIDSADEYSTIVGASEQLKMFKDCIYVISRHEVYKPMESGAFRLLKEAQFNAVFGKYTFKLNSRNEASSFSRKAFDAIVKSQLCNFPKVDDIRFDPTCAPKSIFIEKGDRYLNSYDPTEIIKVPGDASMFVGIIRKNFPHGHDADILLSWMSACVQYPGRKFTWAPVLQGAQGSGKTTITECLAYAVGRQFVVTPKAAELATKFNGWMSRALLVVINEMKQDRETEDEIKKLVTDSDIIIEEKGRDQFMARNFANFIFTLNEKSHFKKVAGNRRFCVMYSALQTLRDINNAGLSEEYFLRFNNWLKNENGYAIVAHYLSTYQIDGRFNPVTTCVRAPFSSSETEVYENSRPLTEVILREAVEDGLYGFKGGWVSLKQVSKLFPDVKDLRSFKRHLNNMGYVMHPGLTDGQLTRVLIEESPNKIRVYCSEALAEKTKDWLPGNLTDAYQKAQRT